MNTANVCDDAIVQEVTIKAPAEKKLYGADKSMKVFEMVVCGRKVPMRASGI